jgi:hypothetical protein
VPYTPIAVASKVELAPAGSAAVQDPATSAGMTANDAGGLGMQPQDLVLPSDAPHVATNFGELAKNNSGSEAESGEFYAHNVCWLLQDGPSKTDLVKTKKALENVQHVILLFGTSHQTHFAAIKRFYDEVLSSPNWWVNPWAGNNLVPQIMGSVAPKNLADITKVIYAPCDENEGEFSIRFADIADRMLAIPFSETESRRKLFERFCITSQQNGRKSTIPSNAAFTIPDSTKLPHLSVLRSGSLEAFQFAGDATSITTFDMALAAGATAFPWCEGSSGAGGGGSGNLGNVAAAGGASSSSSSSMVQPAGILPAGIQPAAVPPAAVAPAATAPPGNGDDFDDLMKRFEALKQDS